MDTRDMSVAGTFYPNDKKELNRYFNHFNKILEKSNFNIDKNIIPKALIVPHAGYVYSGFTANAAYRYTQNINPKKIIVIGPSHKISFEGISIGKYDKYKTPNNDLEVDLELLSKLKKRFEFITFKQEAHQEHSTETQFPFISHYFKNIKVIELVYGKIEYLELSKLIEYLLEDKDNFIIISTDLSHFYKQKEAKILDNICLYGIKHININSFDKGCEACGIVAMKAIINSAKKQNMQSKIIDYRTSSDASGDTSSVVGYVSAIIGKINH